MLASQSYRSLKHGRHCSDSDKKYILGKVEGDFSSKVVSFAAAQAEVTQRSPERCVTTLKTAAKETTSKAVCKVLN